MNYNLICSKCGKIYDDSKEGEWRLSCDNEKDPNHGKALLVSFYLNQNEAFPLNSKETKEKLSDFSSFLPLRKDYPNIPVDTSAPICFKSKNFGEKYLNLQNLWISFNGFIENRDYFLSSCTFKELEATSIFSRIFSKSSPDIKRTVVVSSAGNTARAFAQIFSKKISLNEKISENINLIIVVPEKSVDKIWSIPTVPFDEKRVKLIIIKDGDYSDAIKFADLISSLDENIFFPEGGAKNPARRDGMAISLLAAVFEIQKQTGKIILPDHYFQAVGSGTGGISAWEAAKRIQEFLNSTKNNSEINKNNISKIDIDIKMKMHLSQNVPFTPMADSWEKDVREMPDYCFDENEGKKRIDKVSAFVLTN
jgi:cysteate synthase